MAADSEPPAPPHVVVDAQQEDDARRFAQARRWLLLISLASVIGVIALVFLFGLQFTLRDALGFASWEPFPRWQPLLVLLFFAVVFVGQTLLDLPISWFGGYTLPRRYGLSTQSLAGWARDELKQLGLTFSLEALLVSGLYVLLALTPTWWWLWAGLAVVLVTVVLAQLTPVLFLPMFYTLSPLPEGTVRSRALALAERARTPVQDVYSIDFSRRTTAANAAVVGLGHTRRIIIGDTLLEQFTPEEIDVVVAHELGHQAQHDIPLLILTQSALMLVALYLAHLGLDWAIHALPGYQSLADAATLFPLLVILGAAAVLTVPLVNGLSRWVEHRADVFALKLTRDSTSFISAMRRLAAQNLEEVTPHPLIELFLLDHPSIGRRIAFGQRWQAAHERETV